jgi:hypothetical protein
MRVTTFCGSSCTASGAQVRSGTPTLSAVPGDPDGGTLRVEFEVYDAARTTLEASSGSAVTNRAVNQAAPWTVAPSSGTALPEGSYSWRVRGCDTYVCGGYTGWFDFTVDMTRPIVTDVGSTMYPPESTGTWSGGIGQPGGFRVNGSDPSGSGQPPTLPSSFQMSLNGGAYTAWTGTVTPDRDGVNTLKVKAFDLAGNVSDEYVYDFLVRPAATRSWVWGFDEGTGTTTASIPSGNTLTGSGTLGWVAGRSGATGAASFDGSTRWTTSNPIIDATSSFTVTAWVKLGGTNASNPRNAVSQDGTVGSTFRLQYRTDLDLNGDTVADPAWCFVMFATDGGAESRVCSTESVGTGWVHLAGVYDKGTGMIMIYVGGVNLGNGVDTRPFTGTWASSGKWAVGRALVAGVNTHMWYGGIDRVAVYTRALTPGEIANDRQQP